MVGEEQTGLDEKSNVVSLFLKFIKTFADYILHVKRFFSALATKISYFVNVMTPDKKTRMFWDTFIGCILVVEIVYIPIYVSFLDEASHQNFNATTNNFFEKFFSVMLFFDIFLNFFTGYYEKGLYIDVKRKIAKHYLKKQFFLDLIPTVFLVLVFWNGKSKYFSLIFLVNVVKLKKISYKIEDSFHLHLRFSSLLRLFKLASLMLFLSHMAACSWHMLAVIEISYDATQTTWLHQYNMINESLQTRYISSFYYSIVTIVTVGYGDILPQNSAERVFSSFLILLGCGTFGYCLSNLGTIFIEFSQEENKYKTKIAEINDYMKRNNVNYNLQIKVRRYLEYLFNEENQGDNRGEAILQTLSKSLKDEIMSDVYGRITKNIQILNRNFSNRFLKALTLKFKEVSFAPEEIIFKV